MHIPKPKYNLHTSGGNHGEMTGQMMIKIEEVLLKENPDVVLLITMGGSKEILEKLRSNMRDNAIWHDVNAVKNNRVYQLPPSLFTVNPGTHTIDAMKIMKEYMYGDVK